MNKKNYEYKNRHYIVLQDKLTIEYNNIQITDTQKFTKISLLNQYDDKNEIVNINIPKKDNIPYFIETENIVIDITKFEACVILSKLLKKH